jgi:epoxyqueuosine reductase QueG
MTCATCKYNVNSQCRKNPPDTVYSGTYISIFPAIFDELWCGQYEQSKMVVEVTYICDTCQKVCGSFAGLKAHQRSHK